MADTCDCIICLIRSSRARTDGVPVPVQPGVCAYPATAPCRVCSACRARERERHQPPKGWQAYCDDRTCGKCLACAIQAQFDKPYSRA